MQVYKPQVGLVSGPNGSGKSTVAEILLRSGKIQSFINADIIAKGLNSLSPDKVSVEAGRMMLEAIDDMLLSGQSFSFETTLSGKLWKKFIVKARSLGYEINIFFVVVDNVDTAISRVSERVKKGGHSIPESTIRRRFIRSLEMFKTEYSIIADRWWVFDNTSEQSKIIAAKNNGDSFISNEYKRIFNE